MLHKALEGAVMLETFPKTTVDVFALVLESGGSELQLHTNLEISVYWKRMLCLVCRIAQPSL
jgi:hypothetical protein